MKSILISTSSFGVESKAPIDLLEKEGIRYEFNPHNRKLSPRETIDLLKEKSGVIAGTEAYSKEVVEQLPNLKIISRCGAGIDGIDIPFLEKQGIKLYNTPNVHISAVAELTLAGLFSITRKIPQHYSSTSAGQWNKFIGTNVNGKTAGLIGYGKVSKSVAEVLSVIGCKVMAFDPYYNGDAPDYVKLTKDIFDIWSQSDIISLHAPSTPETKQIINKNSLAKMRPSVILLNTSRGDLVDEMALTEFLENNTYAFAYLDVFQKEPYSGPLTKLPNVIATPHIGTFTRETRVNMEIEATTNLINFFKHNG